MLDVHRGAAMIKIIIVSAKYRTHLLVFIVTHTLTALNIKSHNNDVSEIMVVKLKSLVLHFRFTAL